jgi:hypothetical protein
MTEVCFDVTVSQDADDPGVPDPGGSRDIALLAAAGGAALLIGSQIGDN